jgi:hypothetical protein
MKNKPDAKNYLRNNLIKKKKKNGMICNKPFWMYMVHYIDDWIKKGMPKQQNEFKNT